MIEFKSVPFLFMRVCYIMSEPLDIFSSFIIVNLSVNIKIKVSLQICLYKDFPPPQIGGKLF